MPYALQELFFVCIGLVVLPIFFFAPGYIVASACDLMAFRSQSWIERGLWATALSTPLALLVANHPFLPLKPSWTTALFLLLALLAVLHILRDRKLDQGGHLQWDRNATLGVCGALFLVLYCVFSALPLPTKHGLYESSIWQDWGVRIQLVNAAIRGGNVPANPMFAPAGQPAPLRYYYFWYILCARLHDVGQVSARAAFTVSCVGAALSLLAFLFLSVKYLGQHQTSVRRTCVALMVVSCVLGLDLVALVPLVAMGHIFPNVEFWLEDRTPRLLQVILWSPHHAAGLICAGMGLLLLVCCPQLTRRQQITHLTIAGVCFAAGAGTSTFITALFGSALFFVVADALLRREPAVVWSTAGATVLALVLDAPFLLRLRAAQAGARQIGTAEPLLRPLPRYMNQTLHLIWTGLDQFGRHFLQRRIYQVGLSPQGHFKLLLSVLHRPIIPILFFLDMGFFAFVLFWQARHDFLVTRPMARPARIRWLIFFGIAIPGTGFTSAALQSNNDFARHAGLGMEYVLLLWSAPLLLSFLDRRRAQLLTGHRPTYTWYQRLAAACFVIGLAGQVVQIFYDRFRMPLTDAGLVHRVVVAEYIPRIGYRYEQIQQAMSAAAHLTPPDGIVQQNPHTQLAPVFLLYTNRQIAASDDGCNTPFGGDPAGCLPMTRALVALFGGTGRAYFTDLAVLQKPIEFNPFFVTPSNFRLVCAADKLSLLAATYTDPVWWDKQSWVWQLQPVFKNNTVRLYRCDAPAV